LKQNNISFQLEDYSIKISKMLVARGFQHGDVVAILAGNRPEYIGLWLGMCRVGVVAALINTNLRKMVLRHSINISNAKALIYAAEFADGNFMRKKKLLMPTK
jgi:solute carrier family 27 (fatty acid transporter), member 1/4